MPSTIHQHVVLQVISADNVYEIIAEIRAADDEMVISVSETYGPYVIRGKRVGGAFFAGVNESQDDEPADVVARWSLLGDIWVGYWREEGEECLFSFRLPRAVTAPATKRHRQRT